MSDNRLHWDDWKDAEDHKSQESNALDFFISGDLLYRQASYRRAADFYHKAADLAESENNKDFQCKCLLWEGYCYSLLSEFKKALTLLLYADQLEGGSQSVRFHIVSELFDVANKLPLPKKKLEELLKKLEPYKKSAQIGDSKSIVLQWEGALLSECGDYQNALNCAEEALVLSNGTDPCYDDCYYYRALVKRYCENNMMDNAWNVLMMWKILGSTTFAKARSWQFRAEAQLLYVENRLTKGWDAIRRCQMEEQYLQVYGIEDTETLIWLIRIAVDLERWKDARSCLPVLFRFHTSDSLFFEYDCFWGFTYYYAGLLHFLKSGGISEFRYETLRIVTKRVTQCFKRLEAIGKELDLLMETDVKRKELDALRKNCSIV